MTQEYSQTTQEYPQRIWFNPPKFWRATQGMSKEEVDRIMDRVWTLAERHDFAGLGQFNFIHIGSR
ncbi:MAG TPA: hypothetical protein VG892_08155 [Terriglobales bacterium]|jgi:hypothetical protein|nr:hypothetical protein [Terriglobales bacterium]